jgi:hypothetical protein
MVMHNHSLDIVTRSFIAVFHQNNIRIRLPDDHRDVAYTETWKVAFDRMREATIMP